MLSRPRRTVSLEETLGNGNCAFNAFALGWCDAAVLDYLELYHAKLEAFRIHAAAALHLTAEEQNTWQHFKAALLAQRARDKEALQRQLAPVFRHLAIGLIEANPDTLAEIKEHFLGAFDGFVSGRLGDDIFIRHPFIRTLFENTRREVAPGGVNQYLSDWWDNTGCTQFLAEMKKDRVWAGDIELGALAKYFHVNLDVVAPRFANPANPTGKVSLVGDSPGAPTVTLTNPYAAHWSNMRETEVAPVVRESRIAKPAAFFQPASRWNEICDLVKAEVPADKGPATTLSLESYIQKNGFDTQDQPLKKEEVQIKPMLPAQKADLIEYSINGTTVKVDIPTQILLDQELAKKLQEEEKAPTKKRSR